MSDGDVDMCGGGVNNLYIALFIFRLMAAALAGTTFACLFFFLTIPLALIMTITLCCMACDKKCAKGKGAIQYMSLMATYYFLWIYGF